MNPKLIVVGVVLAFVGALAAMPAPAACPRADDAKYVGSKSCQKCHFKEYASWQKTKMALAFNTLKPNQAVESKTKAKLDPAKDYTKEAGCVLCHVTGYGKPGGYPEVGKAWSDEDKLRAPLMEGVGCESCHGPGEKTSPFKKDNKEYKWADLAKLGAVHPDENNCKSCHNEKSPSYHEFKFAEKIGKDTHEIQKMKADHACDHKHAEGK
jgi:formate-dependent nitrite reductase cytochrome c552 subunit